MKKPTRILIVEDTAADAELARHVIRKVLEDCEFQVVETPKDFLQALEVLQPDLILSDYSLPHFNGLKALQLTLEHAPLTPLIIWTSSISEDVAVDCMKAGANNYVIKENLKRLGPAVVHALEERETLIARRQAEESLKERERQLTMLFSNLPGPVYRCSNDPDYTVEFISDGITELSGYQAEDFREHRRHFGRMIHPDDRERIWEEIQAAVERHQPFELTYRILTATGEQKWVWEKGQGIWEAAGRLQALEGFITDITERKQAEQVLFQSLEQIERSQNLLLRLSEVGRAIQRARSADEVYRAICEGMSGLGYRVSILTLREDKKHLTMAHTTLSSKLVNAVEKFTGFSIWSYPIPIKEDGFLKKIFGKSEAILTIQTEADIARLLPGPLQILAGKLQSLLNFRRVIGAQIIVGDEPQGVIIVDGPELTEFDTLPITALAAQASVALENAQLYESVQQELSERKEAEAKLAKSEERYHYLFENNPHPMWLYDRKTLAFLDVNEAAIAKYKYSRQEFLNMTIADIRPPEDRKRLMENLGQDRSVLERSDGWMHRLKDGTIINVEITSHVVEVDQRESVLVVAQDITERIQAEEALRASEIRFRTFVDHATDAFFLHDEDEQGRILDVNRQACEGLGYSREELIGLTPLDFDLDIAPITLKQRRTRLDAGEAITFDTRHRRKDGTAFPVEVRMRSFKQGGRRFAISLVHNITGRKQAEARINDLLTFNEKILNHSPIGVLTYKLTGECVYANESAAAIIGTSVEQLQSQNFHTIGSWRESGLYDLVEETIKTKVPVTSDIHHVSTFGKDLWMTIHCVTFQSKGEDHVLLFLSDITERKRAEEALRESENRLVLALSGAQMSVWEWNLQTNQILWSPDFFELTGIGQNEFGKTFESFTNLIHSDDVERVMASAQKAMNEKTLFAEEFRIVRSNGEVHWLSNLGHAEYDPTGENLRLIGTIQDITRRKQAEVERQTLLEIMQGFAHTRGLQELMKLIHHAIARVISAENFYVVLYQPDSGLFEEIYMVDQYDPPGPPSRLERSITSHVFHSGEPLLLTQTQFDEMVARNEVEPIGTNLGSWLGAPLKASDRIIGVMAVQDYENPDRYSEHDRDFLASIATQIALAIEHREAGTALRESEERYRAIFEGVQDAIFVESIDGKILMVNERACEMFGYSRAEFLTRTAADLIPEGQQIMTADELSSSLTAVPRETFNRRANGEVFPIEISGRLQVINGETVVLVVIRDITERKQAEEALRESENRLALALSGAQMSVWEWDLRDNHIFWTPKFFEIVGIRENEFDNTFEAFIRLIHSDDAARMVVSIQKAMIEGGSFAEEFRVVHPDGVTRWLSSLGHTEYDPTWKRLRMIGTVQDITGRKQAETALMESMAQFRTLFEASPDAILLLDPSNSWSIIDCNTAACQMNGYRREELIGQHIDILNATPSDPDKWEEHLERTRQQGILRYEINHRRKDGSVFTVEVSNSLIHFGKRDIVLGIDRDITQRKQSEAETRRHMAELEALYKNGLAVGRLLKPAEIGNQVIETFARYLSWHHVAIRLRREESDDLELVAFNLPTLKEEERSAAEQHFIARVNKVGHGLSGWVIQTGVPLRTGNVHAHPQYIGSHAGTQSGLYMPLKAGERVIGVISVESETPNAFTEQDERLLATLANQAAIAFENARLYETIQKELAERKRAEEALRVSETHYRELANSITDILFELDRDFHITHWNKASEVVTGIPVERAIGKPIHEIFGATEERIGLEQIYKDVLKDHQPRTFETAIVLNGEKHSFDVNVYPSTRGMSVVAKDVTERKRSEIILRKRFELMEYSATHTLGELIVRTVDEVSDLTGSAIGFFHFVEADQTTLGTQVWSTNALQLHTVPIGEGRHLSLEQAGVWAEAARQRRSLIQNDYASLPERKGFHEGHVPVTREIVMPVIRNERMMAIIGIGNKTQDYTSYDLEIAERLVDYAWDIIERKQMEVVLAEEHDQLAQRVEERTSDLSRANANLARALRVKDEFLANMSHELRTPLNAILGLSESLAEQIAGPLNEKQQKYINTISESGHHLLSLINDILDLAKIESGQITLDINKVDIHSVCQSSLRMIKQLAQKKNQEVFLKINDGLGLMWADERRLKQMIVNLLSNAVKFTPENGRLGLEVHGDEAANKITITVWDNGIGIRDNDLMRLFRPFVQLDSGLAREATGTGLGLALVAQMARLHGGSVGAVSEPEKGSRFSIILPWEPALAVDAATRLKVTGKFRAIKPDQTNRPTILLVEDTQEVTMMIRDYLELAGYKVVTAQDGVDALVQARLARPNLILMDVQMPRMDGLEATRKLRAEPDFKDTPIVALTALAMSSDRERCLAAGMDEYLSKPIHLKGLVKVIQGFLSNREESQPR